MNHILSISLLALTTLSVTAVAAPTAFPNAGSANLARTAAREAFAWAARHGLTSAQFQATFNDLVGVQGYSLRHVNGYAVGGQARFAAIWDTASAGAWQARHDQTAQGYQTNFDTFTAQGYRLKTVSGYASGGQELYAAIWEQKAGPAWQARHGLSSAQYQTTFDSLVAQGYRPTIVNGYEVGGVTKYAALFEQVPNSPAWVARHGLTGEQYQTAFDQYTSQGYRPLHVSGYTQGGQARFAAVWDKSPSAGWVARHGLNSAQYQAAFDTFASQGYRLRTVSGYGVAGTAYYAAVWEK